MNNRDFTYWMEGFFEISAPQEITKAQLKMIQEHINLVKAIEPLSGFVLWLDGFLTGQTLLNQEHLGSEPTKAINNELRKYITNVMKDEKFSKELFDSLKRPGQIDGMRFC